MNLGIGNFGQTADDKVKAVGHAVGADVADDKLPLQPQLPKESLVFRARSIELQVGAVGHHLNLFGIDTPCDEVSAKGLRHRDDLVGIAIKTQLDLLQPFDGPPLLHGPDGIDGFRPEIP